MSLDGNITSGFLAVATALRNMRKDITGAYTGNLTGLTTTAKTSLIDSINELKTSISSLSSVVLNDTASSGTTTTYSASKIESRLTEIVNNLVNGAGTAYDTLKELGDLIQTNQTGISNLLTAIGNRVRYDAAQTLNGTQAGQARTNIGAAAASDVATINSTISTIQTTLTNIANDIAGLDTRLDSAEATIASHTTSINTLTTTTSTHAASIASINATLTAANIDYSAQFNTALIA